MDDEKIIPPEETAAETELPPEETAAETEQQFNDAPPTGKLLGKLTLIYEEKDIYDASRIQNNARVSLRVMNIAMIALAAVGVVTSLLSLICALTKWDCFGIIKPQDTPNYFTVFMWIMLFLFVLYILFVSPKKAAARAFEGIKQDQDEGKTTDFSVYEDGVFAESRFGKQTFAWSEFKEAYECPAGIVLITNARGAVFFPQRLLKGFDRDRLSEVLEANFGKKYYVSKYE